MTQARISPAPPFCPNPECRYHRSDSTLWRFVRIGFYQRQATPTRIQRYRCGTCLRRFSDQTFSTTYWMRRPDIQLPILHRLVSCSCFRQIARELGVTHLSIARQSARLGRHCLLLHQLRRPKNPPNEPIALDSFESFEWSQYYPTSFHVAVGQQTHFAYGFTESECRRRGSMTDHQRRRRADLEARFGRPDPRAIEKDVAALLAIVAEQPQRLELHTDQHKSYPRAIQRVPHLEVDHRTVSSRAARTPRNPLFPVNLLDLLIRHSSSNHTRETIAFSKRRASAIERLMVLFVWRNLMKSISERSPGTTPAMRLGIANSPLSGAEVLGTRLFPSRIGLPERWIGYYSRGAITRAGRNAEERPRRYAF